MLFLSIIPTSVKFHYLAFWVLYVVVLVVTDNFFFCRYAAVFAAFVAGMACTVGMDFGAKFMASFAKCFEV